MRTEGEPTLVVGGGIAGIVAALRGAAAGQRVMLVEKQPALGGLLSSWQPAGSGHWFDCGTHLPADTGEAALDEMLFGWFESDQWQTLPVVKAANYWNGTLNGVSPCLDLRTLPRERYEAVLPGLLDRGGAEVGKWRTLAEQITAIYGAAMLRWVFEPVLRKFYARGAEELAPDAHLLFGLIRFICLDAAKSRELKQDAWLDRKLAFHSYHETPSHAGKPARTYYPREGGVGRWVAGLESRLVEAGVEIRTGTVLQRLDLQSGRAHASDGREFGFGQMIWSLPPGMLLRLCGHDAARELTPPAMSTIALYHFVTDVAPLTDAHYVTCYDPALRSFRVTLYSNLQSSQANGGRITVEVLSPSAGDTKPSAEAIFSELKHMRLLAPHTRAVESYYQTVPGAFPIQSVEFRRQAKLAADVVASDCPKVRLLGRAAGRSFFMRDVLRDAWNAVDADQAVADAA